MTLTALAKHLFSEYPKHRVTSVRPSSCKHRQVTSQLQILVGKSNGLLTMEEAGRSLEGRSIPLVRFGNGPKRVLLWSQMHGDESTATLALMDIFKFLSGKGAGREIVRVLIEKTSLFVIPMLNPDGAERRQRQTATGIDMNRDARLLSTPEAKVLRRVHKVVKPDFAFNLHDQELSTVGNAPSVTAIALLAPAADGQRRMSIGRTRAMRVAGLMAKSLKPFASGHIARYDDSYESRAFGDNMQSWGTSTVLVESGHWPNDPEKRFIRRLNFTGLLTALSGIASGEYRKSGLREYSALQQNGKRAYHLVIRVVRLRCGRKWEHRVDIGINIERSVGRNGTVARIKEIGDLKGFAALEERDGRRSILQSGRLSVEQLLSLRRLSTLLRIELQER